MFWEKPKLQSKAQCSKERSRKECAGAALKKKNLEREAKRAQGSRSTEGEEARRRTKQKAKELSEGRSDVSG
jgi:hypothetical protein